MGELPAPRCPLGLAGVVSDVAGSLRFSGDVRCRIAAGPADRQGRPPARHRARPTAEGRPASQCCRRPVLVHGPPAQCPPEVLDCCRPFQRHAAEVSGNGWPQSLLGIWRIASVSGTQDDLCCPDPPARCPSHSASRLLPMPSGPHRSTARVRPLWGTDSSIETIPGGEAGDHSAGIAEGVGVAGIEGCLGVEDLGRDGGRASCHTCPILPRPMQHSR